MHMIQHFLSITTFSVHLGLYESLWQQIRTEREDLRSTKRSDYDPPSNALSTLLCKIDKSGIPTNIKEVGIDSFKRLLLEMCIRAAKWIRKHPNSLKLQKVPIEEFEQTFHYGLKDITKLDGFNQVVDWENSSFFKQLINHLALLVKYP